jgi:hypothetical protein
MTYAQYNFLASSLQDKTLQAERGERNIRANMEFMNSVHYPVRV